MYGRNFARAQHSGQILPQMESLEDIYPIDPRQMDALNPMNQMQNQIQDQLPMDQMQMGQMDQQMQMDQMDQLQMDQMQIDGGCMGRPQMNQMSNTQMSNPQTRINGNNGNGNAEVVYFDCQWDSLDAVEEMERDLLYDNQMYSSNGRLIRLRSMSTSASPSMSPMQLRPHMTRSGSHQGPAMNQQMTPQMMRQMSPQMAPQVAPSLPHVPQIAQLPQTLQQVPQQVSQQPPSVSQQHAPQQQVSQQVQLSQDFCSRMSSQTFKRLGLFAGLRQRYKPRSSIPPDLSSINYAAQCIAAAESSRLSPYSLSLGEYNHLRKSLPHAHVTTYLNIRNGILRLWLANPLVAVTVVEAAGCCKEARYYKLAEFAFEWLIRNGYINQGCCTHQSLPVHEHLSDLQRKPRQAVAIVGAGIAGLSCARQLENLLQRYSEQILADYEDIPRVVVFEGRKRIGGRVYSPMLSTEHASVDLGGDTVMGFGGGNPLGVVMRRQLGIPVVSVDTTSDNNVLYRSKTGDPIGAQVDYRAHEMFKHLLDRIKSFEMDQCAMKGQQHSTAGVKTLIRASQDPHVDTEHEKMTISQLEEALERPYTVPTSDDSDVGEHTEHEIKVELDFLQSLGFKVKQCDDGDPKIRVHPEQTAQGVSLGFTMRKLVEHLSSLTDMSDDDRAALGWYFAKFEYQIGNNIDYAGLSSWSHHRENRFSGRYAWARDGMGTLAKGLDTVPGKLDVRFKTVVNVIEYEEDQAHLTLENGEQLHFDRCVVTVPLGVLKRRSMQFIPDLPQWKIDSIDRLEFGVVNKIVLVFDVPFWDPSTPSMIRVANDVSSENDSTGFVVDGSTSGITRGDCFLFQNHTKRCGVSSKALIVGLCSGKAAKWMSGESDHILVDEAVAKLRKVFRKHENAESAKLVESFVTRWQLDRFSRGTFSHIGVEGTSTDHDLLARPVHRSLFFAGEATSRAYPGTIHGAYISGLRAAKEILNSFVGGIEVPDNLIDDELARELAVDGSKENVELSDASSSTKITPQLTAQLPQHQPQIQHQQQQQMLQAQQQQHAQRVAQNLTTPLLAQPVAQPIPSSICVSQAPSRTISPQMESAKRSVPSPDRIYEPVIDIPKAQAELAELRQHRKRVEREQLERDMMHEIGQKPVKPARHGITNPFLLFQKDYWDICRGETEAVKLKDKKGNEVHASRNEIRANLGKKWKTLPADERAPYLEQSRLAKVDNEERHEVYLRKLKWYESEAANFQQQWTQDHPPQPTLRERQLAEQLEGFGPHKKRSRLTD